MEEKKEIGKLLELLNKYLFELGRKTIIESYRKDSLEDVCGTFRGIVEGKKDYPYTSIWGIEVISKKFGFIKWLVENDKIDRDKCGFKNEGLSGNWYDSGIAFVQNYDNDTYKISEFYSPYLQLLMLLSISDTPIEDLLLYLK